MRVRLRYSPDPCRASRGLFDGREVRGDGSEVGGTGGNNAPFSAWCSIRNIKSSAAQPHQYCRVAAPTPYPLKPDPSLLPRPLGTRFAHCPMCGLMYGDGFDGHQRMF